jgi:MSHA biogenesis protein MshJ
MKFDWKALVARIDDMSLRERGMLFASASLVILVLAHVLLIEPALRAQKSLIDRLTRDQSQMNAVRSQIEKLVQSEDARNPGQEAIRALEKRIDEATRAMADRQKQFVAPERLPALLKEMLGANRQVRLESLKLLPGSPVQSGSGELYRHGVEISVRGSYFDLLRYLEDLEKLPSPVLWGKVALEVEQYPEVRLTVVVHTLSRQRILISI